MVSSLRELAVGQTVRAKMAVRPAELISIFFRSTARELFAFQFRGIFVDVLNSKLISENYEPISHPAHIHGHNFAVLDMGTMEQLKNGETAFANATHLPVLKDTVLLPPASFVRIRLRACNPGYWFFHCHYEYHMWTGMTLTFKVGSEIDFPTIPSNFPRCGNFLPPTYEL